MRHPAVFGIEGLDRLGKSTLIQGILNKLGYFQVIHFSKPQVLDIYNDASSSPAFQGDGGAENIPQKSRPAYFYQSQGFRNSMVMAKSGARIIFDRWHLGEVVYSPMYRGYDGSYVYDQEKNARIHERDDIRLILLVEDFESAKHFVDDGESLGPIEKRQEEQQRFIDAFNRSSIKDKRIICVTDKSTGQFRSKEYILFEALKDDK